MTPAGPGERHRADPLLRCVGPWHPPLRYLNEGLDVIGGQAPELARGQGEGWAFVCLGGTWIASTRSATRSETGHVLWCSGRHHRAIPRPSRASVLVGSVPEPEPQGVGPATPAGLRADRGFRDDHVFERVLSVGLGEGTIGVADLARFAWAARR